MSKQIDFNNLTNYFKIIHFAPMNFISFKGPLNTYENINNGNISIKEANEIQNKFKLNLNETARGKPKTKPKDKKDIIKKY